MDLEQLKKRKKELHLTYFDFGCLSNVVGWRIWIVFFGWVGLRQVP